MLRPFNMKHRNIYNKNPLSLLNTVQIVGKKDINKYVISINEH